jgi:hypothetical protein
LFEVAALRERERERERRKKESYVDWSEARLYSKWTRKLGRLSCSGVLKRFGCCGV